MWHTQERNESFTRFLWESTNDRDHPEDWGIDRRMGSEWILGRLAGGVEWIQSAQDRDQWWALVNMEVNLCVFAM
jgi:hypothetical protein